MAAIIIEALFRGRVPPEVYAAAELFIRTSPTVWAMQKRLAQVTKTHETDWPLKVQPSPLAADLPPVPTEAEIAKGRDETRKQTLKHFSDARERVQEHCRKTGATGHGAPVVAVDVHDNVLRPTKPRRIKAPRHPGPRREGGLFDRINPKPTTTPHQ